MLLAQVSIDDFVDNRAEIKTSDCMAADAPVINAVKIESDDESLALEELQLDDGFSSTESFYINNKHGEKSWQQLANATCVSKISLLGHGIGARQTKRSLVKVWAYRQ
jgi:hypothetical protein